MNKKILAFIALILCSFQLSAQGLEADNSVISTAGGNAQVGGLDVTWTLGELFVQTLSEDGVVATQGFNQPKKKAAIVECNLEIPVITIIDTSSICNGGTATLTVEASDNILWSTGQTTPRIIVNSSGSYTVTVTDTSGCSVTSAPLNIGLSEDDCFFCSGQLDTLQLCRKGALFGRTDFPVNGNEIYNWYNDNGDLITSLQGNPYYSPTTLGTYTLEVIDPDYPECTQILGPKTITELNGCCELEECEREVLGPASND